MDVAFLRGGFVPLADANISIRTHSFLYGTGVFEGIKAYWSPTAELLYIFRAEDHYLRLLNSCKILRLTCPQSLEQMIQLSVEILQRNQFRTDTYLRPIVYKADCRIGPILTVPDTQDDFCLFAEPMGAYLAKGAEGLHLGVSSWRRLDDNMIPARAKVNGAYVNTALAKTDAHLMGFDDALVLTADGHIAEGSAMNFMMVRNGTLITPSVTENILEGITRDTILTLAAQELGLSIEKRAVDRTEVYIADEILLCGTAAEVSSVTQVDYHPIGDGKPGPITRSLSSLFDKLIHGHLPQYQHWLTPVTPGQ
ncbi:branched-chain amino acid transaminase [Candidatus Cyanaurora vandensis]|uniref:branched-chain amino acid transaminase n=1 Tax=Candidatus Cyanaurora vandensis TaxID=2714958 RepID=UPI00257C1BB1|nr:branched-chain amino acid transaminase [Candidatus Cyanaurora vandensis]